MELSSRELTSHLRRLSSELLDAKRKGEPQETLQALAAEGSALLIELRAHDHHLLAEGERTVCAVQAAKDSVDVAGFVRLVHGVVAWAMLRGT